MRLIARSACIVALAATVVSPALGAQASPLPSVRPLGPIVAHTPDSLGFGSKVFQLSDGRAVVNHTRHKQLVIMDSLLANPVVVADSTGATNYAYGRRGGTALRYLGDTILFELDDGYLRQFLVIDPAGLAVGRSQLPRPSDAPAFDGASPTVSFDPLGRLVYLVRRTPASGAPPAEDSNAVLRSSRITHLVDTAGFVKIGKPRGTVESMSANLRDRSASADMLLVGQFTVPARDLWALLSDGTIAFVHPDFSIDWLDPDGTRRSTPSIAHEWHRLTDSDKAAMLDSLKVYLLAHPAQIDVRERGSTVARESRDAMSLLPDTSMLPEYSPTIGAASADCDGNLWVADAWPLFVTMEPRPLVTTYNVINRLGVLIDRVQIPAGASVIGFGPGFVYLTTGKGATLAKARIR